MIISGIFGDFNARHPNWNDKTVKTHGKELERLCSDNHMHVLDLIQDNTFLCQTGGSIIDIVITKPTDITLFSSQYVDVWMRELNYFLAPLIEDMYQFGQFLIPNMILNWVNISLHGAKQIGNHSPNNLKKYQQLLYLSKLISMILMRYGR